MHLMDRVKAILMRRAARFHETPLDRYHVRVARDLNEHEDAFRLVHAGYVYQGIESVRASELRMTPQHLLPEATVIVAYEGEQLVGTMTVTLDSPAGLPLDKDYPDELAALRHRGARLVEYGSYAIVERCWHRGVSNLLYMAATTLASEVLGTSHVVIGVNPVASTFYRAVFNFAELATARQHATLRAPVVGLVQDLHKLTAFLHRHYRKPMASGHLPVAHFFGEALPCIDVSARSSREAPRATSNVVPFPRANMAASA